MSENIANKGLVTPVSLSFLLFSFTILTVATYYFAMSSVNTKSGRLNYAAAKQDMLLLENRISDVTWSAGSSAIISFQGYGEEFETKPEQRRLTINVTLGSTWDIVFNATIGHIRYVMPSVDLGEAGLFLRGDERTVTNKSFSESAQMYIRRGGDEQEIYLGYRPIAVSFLDTSEENLVNIVRIFLVNLNSSDSLLFAGSFRLRIRSVNVTTETRNYNLTGEVPVAIVSAIVDGDQGAVCLPLSSSGDFTLVRIEILVCNVRLEEVSA